MKIEKLNKIDFLKKYNFDFNERIRKSIIETDPETIFPSKNRMIVGFLVIEIVGGNKFKISKIEIE